MRVEDVTLTFDVTAEVTRKPWAEIAALEDPARVVVIHPERWPRSVIDMGMREEMAGTLLAFTRWEHDLDERGVS